MLTKKEFKHQIENTINEGSILNHPFYRKWNEGLLTHDKLRRYAKQYYRFVEHFPMFVSSVHSNCMDKEIRKIIIENLSDEEGYKCGTEDHPALWLKFCKALGLSDNEISKTETLTEIQESIDEFYNLCRTKDYKTGLAALLGYEFQIPEVSRVKIEGLKKFYGISSPEALEFFTVHKDADIYHSRDEMNILLEKCTTQKDQLSIINTVKKSTELYWHMLDGIYSN